MGNSLLWRRIRKIGISAVKGTTNFPSAVSEREKFFWLIFFSFSYSLRSIWYYHSLYFIVSLLYSHPVLRLKDKNARKGFLAVNTYPSFGLIFGVTRPPVFRKVKAIFILFYLFFSGNFCVNFRSRFCPSEDIKNIVMNKIIIMKN